MILGRRFLVYSFENGLFVENVSELPKIEGTFHLDFETTSGSPDKKSTNPWRDCKIAGIAIKSKDTPAYYISVAANSPYSSYNLPREPVINWLSDIFKNSHTWVNQNVKYDAHCAYNDFGLHFEGDYVDTLTRAKLYDSERMYKGGYGLDVLSEHLLNIDIRKYEHALSAYTQHSKDYGDIHPHCLGSYACEDVNAVEKLDAFLWENLPYEVMRTARTEVGLTKELILMERRGMRVKPLDVVITQIKTLAMILHIDQQIKDLVGRWVNTTSPDDMFDVICNMFGMPIIAWTNEEDDSKESNPSFGKHALNEYLSLVNAPKEFIELAQKSRKLKQFNNLFLEAYKTKNIDGILHPTYNQCVRTGRGSCSDPNMQQCDDSAKELIIPSEEGEALLRVDYSQIEYRTIIHYIGDRRAIKAYNENPDTDFHDYVASQIGIPRKPAKTLNFQNAFGGGIKKMVSSLSAMPDVVNRVKADVNLDNIPLAKRDAFLQQKVEAYATKCYWNYHGELPTLKPVSKRAEEVCRSRGYIYTLMGRRRHIHPKHARKAFNAINQGSAADILKEKIVHLGEVLKGTGIKMIAQVHDEVVFSGPKEIINDPRTVIDIVSIMEEKTIPLSVPLRCSYGISETTWADAEHNEAKIPFGSKGEDFKWLKK